MAVGFPYSTGDVLTAADMNGLVAFSTSTQTADYTPVLADQYQTLVLMNKATAVNFAIPTNASSSGICLESSIIFSHVALSTYDLK